MTSSPTPFELRVAIVAMVGRYGSARMELGSAMTGDRYDNDRHERLNRTCNRRFAAIQRLTEALTYRAYAGGAK